MQEKTSRALLLAAVGHALKHAGQTTITLVSMHAANERIMGYIRNIRGALAYVKGVVEQLRKRTPWRAFVDYVLRQMFHNSMPKLGFEPPILDGYVLFLGSIG